MNDFLTNFKEIELTKIIEVSNEIHKVTVIDSTFVTKIYNSYYSAVQGIVFVFNFDIMLKQNCNDTIRAVVNEARESVKGELISVIGLKITESQKSEINLKDKIINQQIENISKEFKNEVFIFSIETGENIEEIFRFLIKRIIFKHKEIENSNVKKKHKKRRHKFQNLPVSTVYRILEKSDRNNIPSDLLFEYIAKSIEERFVLLCFIDVKSISDQKMNEMIELEKRSPLYFQNMKCDLKYIRKIKDENKNNQAQINKLNEINDNLREQLNQSIQCKNEIENLMKETIKIEGICFLYS